MKSIAFSISAWLLVLLAAGSAQEESCPDEVAECAVDPCEGQMCPRFYNAECRPNLCFGGLCTANFFFRGSNVTDRCDVITCDERTCPGTRQCMEEVRPPTCPPELPNCRQALHTRCVLPPDTDRPMTCLDINCTEGEVCRMRLRGPDFPPVVNCFPPERVSDCVPGTCNEGLECVDDGPSVRCVISTTDAPSTTTPSPSTDTTTTEPDTPTTASPTPDTTTTTTTTITTPNVTFPPISPECEALSCGERSQICEDERGARCIDASTCEELTPFCQRVNIFSSCVELNSDPTCLLPPNCDLISCGEFERCVILQLIGAPSDQLFIGFCLPTLFGLTCDELICPPDINLCAIGTIPTEPNSTFAACVSPTELTCEGVTSCRFLMSQREDVTCLDLTQDGRTFDTSCTVLNCELEGCPSSECINFTGTPFTSACEISFSSLISYGTTCSDRADACTGGEVCQEVMLNGTYVLGSFCGSPQEESCDRVTCDEGDVCTEITYVTQPEVVEAECTPDSDLNLLIPRLYQGLLEVQNRFILP